jgi:hypothetical protein
VDHHRSGLQPVSWTALAISLLSQSPPEHDKRIEIQVRIETLEKGSNAMKRSAAFAALLTTSLLYHFTLRAQDAASGEVTVHFDLTDSVRAQLSSGRITSIKVSATSPNARGLTVDTTTATITLRDVPPGKWTLHTMMKMDGNLYVVDERGPEIEVKPGEHVDVTRTIPALVLVGRVTLRGQPFHGQMSIFPSEPKPGNWGFAVPFDKEGRFAFPLPHAGHWDLQMSKDRSASSPIPEFDFREIDALHELKIALPEAEIAGRVVDSQGKGVSGVRVKATLQRNPQQRPLSAAAKTGPDGEFTLDALAGGAWTVSAWGSGVESSPLHIALPEGGRRESVVLHAVPGKETPARASF